jgi:hypothetical protein
VCRHLEIAESTWHRWVAQYGGLKANDAKRLKELEGENVRLRPITPTITTRTAAGRNDRDIGVTPRVPLDPGVWGRSPTI